MNCLNQIQPQPGNQEEQDHNAYCRREPRWLPWEYSEKEKQNEVHDDGSRQSKQERFPEHSPAVFDEEKCYADRFKHPILLGKGILCQKDVRQKHHRTKDIDDQEENSKCRLRDGKWHVQEKADNGVEQKVEYAQEQQHNRKPIPAPVAFPGELLVQNLRPDHGL